MELKITPLAKELKILGDENRFMIVSLLLKYDLCVEALANRLDISKSAVSQHLKILRDAGLVRGEKRGYFTHYLVDRKQLNRIADQLNEMAATEKSKYLSGPDCSGTGAKKG